jgi:hypothetical protein
MHRNLSINVKQLVSNISAENGSFSLYIVNSILKTALQQVRVGLKYSLKLVDFSSNGSTNSTREFTLH